MPEARPIPRERSPRLSGVLIAGAVVALAGCGGRSPIGEAPGSAGIPATASTGAPALEALQAAAERQEHNPDRRAMNAPPPPGVPASFAERIPPDQSLVASTSLAETLEKWPAGKPQAPEALTDGGEDAAPDDNNRLGAMRSYVTGRRLRLDGDFVQAEALLKQAARLDPTSGPVWRELGEAQLAQGNRLGAASAFQRALRREERDARSLDVLARFAIDRKDPDEAVHLLARLRNASPGAFDPALPFLLDARLGKSLIELGRLRAGEEAMRSALALPDAFRETTQLQSELALLYRQRSDLWREVGDAAMRRADAGGAMDAYNHAASLPNFNPGVLTPRRVYAAMRRGRPTEAASILVREVSEARGRVDERTLSLIGYVTLNSSAGPLIERALATVEAGLSPEDRVLASAPLARARAAALDGDKALGVLRTYIAGNPADDEALRDLLSRIDRADTKARVREIALLIERAPFHEEAYVRRLLAGEPAPGRVLEAFESLPKAATDAPGGRLLRARLLAATGDLAGAESQLADLGAEFPAFAPASVMRVSFLSRLGRFEEARALLDALVPDDPQVREAKARALGEMGEYEKALAEIAPLLPAPDAGETRDIGKLLLAARLNIVVGRYKEGEALLRQVLRLDPARDEPYAALLNFYSRSGPLADEAKLVEAVRALRDSAPSSPTLKWLRAQESLGRGQLDLAERDLLDLAESDASRPNVIEALVQLWKNQSSHDRAEEWLRAQALSHPENPVYDIELAKLLTARERGTEAITLLEDRLARMPGDDATSRVLEAQLRNTPEMRPRADEMARARLARSARTPDSLIDLAELEAAADNLDAAAQALTQALSSKPDARPEALSRAADLVVSVCSEALKGKRDIEKSLAFQREVVGAMSIAPPGVHVAGIRLLARTDAPLDRIVEAIEAASAQHPVPARRVEFFSVAAEAFGRKPGEMQGIQREADVIPLIERACMTTEPPPMALLSFWTLATTGQGPMQDLASAVRALELARRTGVLESLAEALAKSPQFQADPPSPAELAYQLGNIASAASRGDLAEQLYRITLRFDRNHIWANNNLGYRMLVEDRDVPEAVRMIELAYGQMAQERDFFDEAPITDSLGFARYKMGILQDGIDANGAPVLGALGLFQRSYDKMRQDQRRQGAVPIIADHLADAAWAAGDRERAVKLWADAAERAATIVQLAATNPAAVNESEMLEEIRAVASRTREKIDAAKSDRPPAITAMHESVRDGAAPPPEAPPPQAPGLKPGGAIQ